MPDRRTHRETTMPHTDTAFVQCPYCGEEIEIVVDGSVDHQQYVEDCSVCCRPIVFTVVTEDGEVVSVDARSEDD
jgi:hypothetical protein